MKIFTFIASFFITNNALANTNPRCNETPLNELVHSGKDIYVGETYGTVEIPALVLEAIQLQSNKKVIVSL